MLELEKHNTELETRVATLHRDNESLRAEVDEADHYVYERGPIKHELFTIRQQNIQVLAEINRLTSESVRKSMELSHAEEGLKYAMKQLIATGAMKLIKTRATATQTYINHFYQEIRAGSTRGSRSPMYMDHVAKK